MAILNKDTVPRWRISNKGSVRGIQQGGHFLIGKIVKAWELVLSKVPVEFGSASKLTKTNGKAVDRF